jgi:hypothetical protein
MTQGKGFELGLSKGPLSAKTQPGASLRGWQEAWNLGPSPRLFTLWVAQPRAALFQAR